MPLSLVEAIGMPGLVNVTDEQVEDGFCYLQRFVPRDLFFVFLSSINQLQPFVIFLFYSKTNAMKTAFLKSPPLVRSLS
jgi:hypothetical protein